MRELLFRINTIAIACCMALLPVQAAEVTRIAAVVNDAAITQEDLDNRIHLAEVAANLPDAPEVKARLTETVLKALIDEQLELQEAAHQNIKIEDADIDKSFARVAEQNKMTPDQFKQVLQAHNVSIESIRAQIKAQIAWVRVVQKVIRPRIEISPEEVDDALNRIKNDAGKPQYLTAEIFLTVDTPEQDAKVKATAEKLVDELRHGGNFALAARQFSQSADAANGGDLGWIEDGQLPPVLGDPLAKLRPGEITDPIKDVAGYHILMVRDRGIVAGPDANAVKLHLLQIVLSAKNNTPAATQQTLSLANSLITDTNGCDAAKAKATAMNDGVSGDLGSVTVSQLPPQILNAVQNQEVGKFTQPLRTPKGFLLLMVCERKAPEIQLPTREEIANKIGFERMDMQQRRYLRDLRASAYVDIRS